MRFSIPQSMRAIADRAKARSAATLAVLGVIAATGLPALAEVPVTRLITNIATVEFLPEGAESPRRVQARADLTVSLRPVDARLRLMQLSCGSFCGADLTLAVPRGAHALPGTAPQDFAPLPAPVNHSDIHGALGPVDLSAPVDLVDIDHLPLGVPLFVVLESRDMSRDRTRPDTALVHLRDEATGDSETLRLVETGPDSGIFAAAIETRSAPMLPGDGKLTTRQYSRLNATFTDPNYPARTHGAEAIVGPLDPGGVTYDATTGLPVSGVELTLIDATTNRPANVLGSCMKAGFPSRVVSGGNVTDAAGREYRFRPGEFRFPMVKPGRYRFEIAPPPGYVLAAPPKHIRSELAFSAHGNSASMLLAEQTFLAGTLQAGVGSFSDEFMVAPGQPVQINVPLLAASVTTVTREASRDSAEAGDFIGYTVTLASTAAGLFTLTDTLPGPIRLVPGSLTVNGAAVDPVMAADGRSFSLPGLTAGPGSSVTVRYTAQVTAAAPTSGALVSQSAAFSGAAQVASASHSLQLADAFDLDRVAILGQVVAGPCGAPETGHDLSGIRILMEDGQYAVTDAQGRFTFRDIARKTRVLQLDELTLPRNARPVLCNNNTRRAGSAVSQFVELRPGLMGRAEFHIVFDGAEDAAEAAAERPSAWRAAHSHSPEAIYTAEWLNRQPIDAAPRILFPGTDLAPTSGAIDVFYLRAQGQTGEVMVNGRSVDAVRREPAIGNLLGTRYIDRWRAVRLEEGRNNITVILRDAGGDEVFRQTRTLHLASSPAFMEVLEETSVLESDGRTNPVVEMRVTDRNGIPLRAGAKVSVRVNEPFGFLPRDIRPGAPAHERQPGAVTQAEVGEGGVIRLELAPVMETATARFEISVGRRVITQRVRISAAERPWVLVGLAEGTLDASRVRRSGLPGGDIRDPATGRVAFFAEGVIRGEWLLTLRYDSDARLGDGFHGIDPDKDYLVYGDASRQGNAAQSRYPLYVRLRKEGAEYLFGDFRTDINTGLVNVNRRMSGGRALLEGEDYRVMAFAARSDASSLEDRIALDGTTGPFPLAMGNLVQHSEVVRLVTTSRLDASEIVESRILVPGMDYTIDRARGELVLRSPIPAFTPAFDRNSIVVTYQVAGAAQSGRVLGLRAERDLDDRLSVGATLLDGTRLEGTGTGARLMGADVTWRPMEDLVLSAEVVQMDKSTATGDHRGRAAEIRAEYEDGLNHVSAYARRQRGNIGFTAATDDVDSDIIGLDFSVGLFDSAAVDEDGVLTGLFLEGRAVRERDRIADTLRHDASAMVVNRREDGVEHGLGLRHVKRDAPAGRSEAWKLLSRAAWVSEDRRLSLSLGTEYTIAETGAPLGGDEIVLAAGYEFSDTFRMFGSIAAHPARKSGSVATFGITAQPFENGSITAGLTRAARGADAGFVLFLGMDQDFAITENTRFSLGMDAQRNLGAGNLPLGMGFGTPVRAETFVTLRAGLERQTDTWGAGIQTEARFGEGDRRANLRLSADTTLGQDWTLSAAAFVGETRPAAGARRREADLRLSAAHRTGAEDPIILLQAELSAREDGADRQMKAYGAVYHSRYLSAQQTLNTRYGVKYTQSRDAAGRHTDLMHFVGAEYRHDVTEKLDLGVHGALMHSARAGTAHSFGLSVGMTPFENGWVSVGYNLSGFRDADFSAQGHTDRGAFLQFRLKFDQHSMRDLLARQNGVR